MMFLGAIFAAALAIAFVVVRCGPVPLGPGRTIVLSLLLAVVAAAAVVLVLLAFEAAWLAAADLLGS